MALNQEGSITSSVFQIKTLFLSQISSGIIVASFSSIPYCSNRIFFNDPTGSTGNDELEFNLVIKSCYTSENIFMFFLQLQISRKTQHTN